MTRDVSHNLTLALTANLMHCNYQKYRQWTLKYGKEFNKTELIMNLW